MKSVILFFGLLAGVVLAGCSVSERDATDVGNQFQDGLSGRGKIVPLNSTNDSFGPEYR